MIKSLLAHWPTAVGLLVVNFLAWATCRLLLLDANSPTLWQDQVGVLQALLVLDTLLVVWWYTDVTATLATTSEKQVATSERQLAQAYVAERIRHKPFCVAARVPLPNSGYEYCVRNIGPGLAVSVWLVSIESSGDLRSECLGALGPGESRTLPELILRPLCDRPTAAPFALFAEALWTRTSQWMATVNARGRAAGSDVFSQFIEIGETESVRSIGEVLNENSATLKAALSSFESSSPSAA
jgi:hypothetical protein